MKPSAKEVMLQRLILKVRPAFLAVWIKNILKIRRRVISLEYGTFFLDPATIFAAAMYCPKGYEPEMRLTLKKYLPKGGTFVDVGANEGFFSILAGKIVGPSGKVVAVEPQSRLHEIILKNISLNKLTNVSLIKSAISDVSGTAKISLAPNTNSGSSSMLQRTFYKLPTEEVKVITLETLLDSVKNKIVDLMKMDIEGFEYEVLLGSEKVLRTKRIRAIALEMHSEIIKERGKKPSQIEKVLGDCGYQLDTSAKTSVWLSS